LGLLDLDLPHGGLAAEALADRIERHLAGALDEHLRDGERPALTPAGFAVAPYRPGPARPLRTPSVSVVVPTLGDPAKLRRCLDALSELDHSNEDYEVVVVDNAPDRSATAAVVAERAATDRRLRLMVEPRRGVAYARNRGLAGATGDLVAFVDDDVVVDRHWLDAIVDGFADDSVAAVTGLVVAAELETPAQVWIERYGGFGKGCRRIRFERTGYEVAGLPRVAASPRSLYPYLPGGYGSGANMAFRTADLRRLGGFDSRLGAGAAVRAGEDIDALMRVVLSGRALVYEPGAVVWHAHRADPRAVRRTVYAYGVGLAAVLTKALMRDPKTRRDVLRRLPRGVLYALRPGSAKNARKAAGYPLSLTLAEWAGMALGPAQLARAGRAADGKEAVR
jgi:glycosyltransferase involved in cell wall biosynthesis